MAGLKCAKCGKEKGLMSGAYWQCTSAKCSKVFCGKCAEVLSVKGLLSIAINAANKIPYNGVHPTAACPECGSSIKQI